MSYLGPLSLLALFAFWAVLFVFGFALLLWGLALPLNAPEKVISFFTYLYLSGTTFFTLGLGDVAPVPAGKNVEELSLLLHDWEVWCADILESHLSYPVLAFYRSQHDQQSWVGALTVVLDTCALILTGIEGIPDETAKFTFAIARHAVVDLSQVLNTSPKTQLNRLSSTDFAHLHDILAASGIRLHPGVATEQKLAEFRETYEPFVSALANHLLVSLPPWIPPGDSLDDWQTTAWDDLLPSTRRTLIKVMHRE